MTPPITKRALALSALLGLTVISACSKENTESAGEEKAPSALAYVTNQNGNITVIDLSTFDPVSEINADGRGPRGIGVTKDGEMLVVANVDSGDISVIDRKTGKVIKHVPIGKNPEFVRVRDGRAYVSFEPASEGGPPPKPGSEEAKALAEKREEEGDQPAKVAVVDLKEGKVIKEITGGMETEGIEFSADGKDIIVTNEADDNITVHDIDSGKLVKDISTKDHGHRPRGIKMAPDGNSYVASIEYGNHLVVMDKDFNIIKDVPTGEVPYGLTFNRDGSRLYVALSKGQAIQVFDTSTWEPIGEVPTGKRCWHFTFTPDDKNILVACGRSDEVVVIDVAEMKPIKHIGGMKLPWGIVAYPKSVGTLDAPWQ